MTALKMIFAVVGTLFFLGLFSVGINTADHQGNASQTCISETNTQDISLIDFNCITAKNTQSNGKG
jgi:hypothetical protein